MSDETKKQPARTRAQMRREQQQEEEKKLGNEYDEEEEEVPSNTAHARTVYTATTTTAAATTTTTEGSGFQPPNPNLRGGTHAPTPNPMPTPPPPQGRPRHPLSPAPPPPRGQQTYAMIAKAKIDEANRRFQQSRPHHPPTPAPPPPPRGSSMVMAGRQTYGSRVPTVAKAPPAKAPPAKADDHDDKSSEEEPGSVYDSSRLEDDSAGSDDPRSVYDSSRLEDDSSGSDDFPTTSEDFPMDQPSTDESNQAPGVAEQEANRRYIMRRQNKEDTSEDLEDASVDLEDASVDLQDDSSDDPGSFVSEDFEELIPPATAEYLECLQKARWVEMERNKMLGHVENLRQEYREITQQIHDNGLQVTEEHKTRLLEMSGDQQAVEALINQRGLTGAALYKYIFEALAAGEKLARLQRETGTTVLLPDFPATILGSPVPDGCMQELPSIQELQTTFVTNYSDHVSEGEAAAAERGGQVTKAEDAMAQQLAAARLQVAELKAAALEDTNRRAATTGGADEATGDDGGAAPHAELQGHRAGATTTGRGEEEEASEETESNDDSASEAERERFERDPAERARLNREVEQTQEWNDFLSWRVTAKAAHPTALGSKNKLKDAKNVVLKPIIQGWKSAGLWTEVWCPKYYKCVSKEYPLKQNIDYELKQQMIGLLFYGTPADLDDYARMRDMNSKDPTKLREVKNWFGDHYKCFYD